MGRETGRGGGDFDAGAFVARARRLAGLSQRELAAAAGVAPATVGGAESGARGLSVDLLAQLLDAAGLRLAVLDREGREVAPFPADTVRDHAGRRFPAHLDVFPPDRVPLERLRSPRYDRRPAMAWYQLRSPAAGGRDQGTREDVGDHAVPRDHPTVAELEFRRWERRYARMPWWPRRAEELRRHLGLGD